VCRCTTPPPITCSPSLRCPPEQRRRLPLNVAEPTCGTTCCPPRPTNAPGSQGQPPAGAFCTWCSQGANRKGHRHREHVWQPVRETYSALMESSGRILQIDPLNVSLYPDQGGGRSGGKFQTLLPNSCFGGRDMQGKLSCTGLKSG